LGKYKAFTQNKRLKIWVDAIKPIVQQKKLSYKKYLQTKKINKEPEYKSRRAKKSHCQKRNQKKISQILGTIYITPRT
jgi:hypothetical protein